MKAILVIVVLFLVAVFAQTPPSTPKFPQSFSSTVQLTSINGTVPPRFVRWFFDYVNQRERTDGLDDYRGSQYLSVVIRRGGSTGVEYRVLTHAGEVSCFTRPLSSTPVNLPDFSTYTFLGGTRIDGFLTNHWGLVNKTSGQIFNYFENAVTREPVEFDIVDPTNVEFTYKFWEFDAGPQDPNLFVVNPLVLPLCGPIPSDEE